jgi:YbbR domain-containing protein
VSNAARKEIGTPSEPLRLIPPGAFRASYLTDLVQRLQRNVGLRVIALLLAIGLWTFVNAGQRGSVQSFNVPVTYRGLPPHLIITNGHPQSVKIEVSGPRTLLSLIDPSRLALRLDLNGVAVGQASFKIGADAFNVPRQTMVTGIAPSQIVLDVDRIVTRDVPVRLVMVDSTAPGYHVTGAVANPHTVQLRGPSKDLARIDDVESQPISLAGLAANDTRLISLAAPSETVRVEPAQVTANIQVGPIVIQKKFHNIPIQVRESDYPYWLQPSHVNLTVRGPQTLLARFDPHGAAYVEADGMIPGSYDAEVQVALPDGVELLSQSTQTTKIRIFHQKQVTRH